MDHAHSGGIAVHIDHGEHLIAAGLTFSLADTPGLRLLPRGRPEGVPGGTDVVITDYDRGLRLATQFRDAPAGVSAGRPPGVMIVSGHDRENDIRLALMAGVFGFVHSHCSADEVLRGVRAVAARNRYLCPSMTQRVADSLTHEQLTARETDVLRLLVLGHSNKAIALSLEIAVGTVKAHVKSIMEKLDAHTRTHAVSVATARGLVSMPAAPSSSGVTAMPREAAARRPQVLSLIGSIAA